MSKPTLFRTLSVLAVAGLVMVLGADVAYANPIDLSSAESSIRDAVRPAIRLTKTILAVLAVLFGMFEAFKASRGSGGSWFKAIALLIVAALIMVPTFILETLGMNQLSVTLRQWGF